MARSLLRSPIFWGAVSVLAVGAGAALYQHRRGLGRPGPAPRVIQRNPARPLAPVSRTTAGGMTLTRYEADGMTIHQRVQRIQQNVWKGVNDPRLRVLAAQLTRHCGRDDGPCEVKAIYDAVRQHVRYTGDIGPVVNPATGKVEAIDLYSSPIRTWEIGIGDCGNVNSLIASLLAWLGHTVRLRVTSPSRFSDWQHIYAVVGVPKNNPRKWLAVDTTLPGRAVAGTEAGYGKALDYVQEFPA